MSLSDEPTFAYSQGELLVGRYRIEQAVAGGGIGHVFEALDTRVGRRCAVKTLRPDRRGNSLAMQRFLRECKLGARLNHPNLVRVLDAGESAEGPFMVMDLLEGQSLAALMRPGQPLAMTTILAVTESLVRALRALGEHRIVHGDIKPANIMMSYDPIGAMRVVLVDFGLAHSNSEPELGPLPEDHHVVSGTPLYLAPEQAMGRLPTAASDVYSAGCVLYEMLTGFVPFGEKDASALMTAHAFRPALAPRTRFPHLTHPHTLELLLMHMLDKEPEMRPRLDDIQRVLQTVRQML